MARAEKRGNLDRSKLNFLKPNASTDKHSQSGSSPSTGRKSHDVMDLTQDDLTTGQPSSVQPPGLKQRSSAHPLGLKLVRNMHTRPTTTQSSGIVLHRDCKQPYKANRVDNQGANTNDCLFYALYDNCRNNECQMWRKQLHDFARENPPELQDDGIIIREQLNSLLNGGFVEWELLHLAFREGKVKPPEANIIIFTLVNQLWSPSSVYFHPEGIEKMPFILVANVSSCHFVNLEPEGDISQAVRLFLHMKAEIIQLEKDSTKWQRDFFQAKGEKEYSEDLAKAMTASMNDPSSSAASREASLEAQLKERQKESRKHAIDAESEAERHAKSASLRDGHGGRRVVHGFLHDYDTDDMSGDDLQKATELSLKEAQRRPHSARI